MESFTRFIRIFWQPLIVVALVLVLLGQFVSWGYTALQMHSIDRLVEAPQKDQDRESDQETPPQHTGRRGPPPGQERLEPKGNIFHRQRVSYQLTAIFKDQAVINGQAVKAGSRIGKATLEEIRLASVMIHEDGKPHPQEIKMFQGAGGGGGPPMRHRSRPRRGPSGPPPSARQSAPPQAMRSAQPSVNRQQVSASLREQLMQKFRAGTLTIDDVPPEHRERFREAMARREARQREGGGPGGPRGRRGPRGR